VEAASTPAPTIAPPTFRGDNARAQETLAREWILSGPSETGKTWATLWRLDAVLRATPGAQGALVRKLAVDIPPTVLVTYRRVVARSGSGATPFGGEKPEWYDYPNGARLYVGGIDRPGRILSGERDVIYVNQAEELDAGDWETLSTRTTGRGAVTKHPMLFGDCNPGDPEHWILKRAAGGALELLRSRHEDNPTLYTDAGAVTEQGRRTLATLDALTGARLARLRHGEWVLGDEDEAFLPSLALWDACERLAAPYDTRQPIVLGLDAAVSGDTFAVVGVSRDPVSADDVVTRLVRVWEPHGAALDYEQIEAELREIVRRYNVVQLAYDPYQAVYLAQRLGSEVWCEPFSQQGARLESDRQLLDLIIQRRLAHSGEPVLRQHVANANRRTDADGRRLRIVKRSPDLKIDAAVALSMATARCLSLNLY
jgi:hypothetical protein